jgi:hypothetical protein
VSLIHETLNSNGESMAKLLFTMVPANDLGLPTRLVPIARMLADRGHEVALFNPSPAPARLISEAGLTNLPMPSPAMPVPGFDPNLSRKSCAAVRPADTA